MLNQKEVVHRYLLIGTATADKILQVLNHLTIEGLVKLKDSRFPLAGETNLYKLMNRSDPLTSVFLNEKVDLNQLKNLLGEQGLPFAFKETKEGINLFFRVKDTELAKKGLERVINDLKQNPKKVLRRDAHKTFDEKVKEARKQYAYKGDINAKKTKTEGRSL